MMMGRSQFTSCEDLISQSSLGRNAGAFFVPGGGVLHLGHGAGTTHTHDLGDGEERQAAAAQAGVFVERGKGREDPGCIQGCGAAALQVRHPALHEARRLA